jgi:hypothetical protein
MSAMRKFHFNRCLLQNSYDRINIFGHIYKKYTYINHIAWLYGKQSLTYCLITVSLIQTSKIEEIKKELKEFIEGKPYSELLDIQEYCYPIDNAKRNQKVSTYC